MQINIINQTSYKQIKLAFNNKEFMLKKEETVSEYVSDNNLKIDVVVFEKNSVSLNLFLALINGFIDDESVVNWLVCNASFNITMTESDATIILKDLEYRDDKKGYIYNSVYFECNDNTIDTLTYKLTDVEKARKKSLFYYIFICSMLPVLLILLGILLLYGDILAIIAIIFTLFFDAVPSWKKAAKVKYYYTDNFANEALISQAIKQKQNNGKPVINESNDIFTKAIHKGLDFIFKKHKKGKNNENNQ